jgi:hypothetical protein
MKQFQQFESKAHEHLRQGDDRAALFCFEQAFDTVLISYGRQAQALVDQGDWEAALLSLKEEIDLSSDSVTKDLHHLGQLLNKIGFLRHCLRDMPGAARAHELALMFHAELLHADNSSTDVISCNSGPHHNRYQAAS